MNDILWRRPTGNQAVNGENTPQPAVSGKSIVHKYFIEQQKELSMKDVDYMHVSEDSINKIKDGALLTLQRRLY